MCVCSLARRRPLSRPETSFAPVEKGRRQVRRVVAGDLRVRRKLFWASLGRRASWAAGGGRKQVPPKVSPNLCSSAAVSMAAAV